MQIELVTEGNKKNHKELEMEQINDKKKKKQILNTIKVTSLAEGAS